MSDPCCGWLAGDDLLACLEAEHNPWPATRRTGCLPALIGGAVAALALLGVVRRR